MQVTCGDCGKRCSVPDDTAPDATRSVVCSMCGAQLESASPEGGSEPRGQLDTLRLDASSLATLVRLGEATHAAASREEPSAARSPQASIPFELARERVVPRVAARAPQASIPFDLVRQEPATRTPTPRPQASIPVELGRGRAADDWEGTFASRVRGRRRRWGLPLFVVFAAVVVMLAALIVSGRIDPVRWLD